MSYADKSFDRRQFLLNTGSLPAFSALALAAEAASLLLSTPRIPSPAPGRLGGR